MVEENKELWTKEAENNLKICAEFITRMILKYGDNLLKVIEEEKKKPKSVE